MAFPTNAAAGAVPAEVMRKLALITLPVTFTMNVLSIAVLVFYRIDQETHERNLAALGEQAAVGEPETAPKEAEPAIISAS